MKTSEDLFELISSLTRTEKGYFKKFTSMHVRGGENNYSRLFDAIEKQQSYDEKKIIKQFKEEKFTRQLSVAKNYLYNLILESLESYHSTVESKLNSLIHQIDILFKKRLYHQAEKILASSKKTALEYEKHLHYLLLIQRELLLISAMRYAGKTEEELKGLFKKVFVEVERANNLFQFWQLNSLTYFKMKIGGGFIRSEADKKLFEEIIKNPLMVSPESATDFLSAFFYNSCHIGYNFSSRNFDKMYEHCVMQSKLIENNLHLAEELPQARINHLLNLSIAQMALKKYNEVPGTVELIRNCAASSEHIAILIYEQANTIEMEYLITTGQFEKALRLFELVEKKFSEAKQQVLQPHQMPMVYFYKAVVLFALGRLRESAKLLNQGLNESGLDYRNDLHCFAKIFSLVVHYELGNQDLLDHMIRSTYRYLLKRNRLYKFETVVINYIRKNMPESNSNAELLSAFTSLKNEIVELTKDPFEKSALELFDYVSWLESKLNNKSYEDMVRQRAGI